jgi:predicted alpha/beta-hydrolase family hydrolase
MSSDPRAPAETLEIETPRGRARAHLHTAGKRPVGALILGHGAGGSVDAPDLLAVTDVALAQRFTVALVEQPYRVAGRRSSPPAGHLDEAWLAVVEHLRGAQLKRLALVVGGRSAGARVACRTAAQTHAVAVLCLAFPLRPPGRAASAPASSRLPELDAVPVPTLVIQGAQDPFGIPPSSPTRTVVTVAGNHGLKSDLDAVAAAAREWAGGPPAVARPAGLPPYRRGSFPALALRR